MKQYVFVSVPIRGLFNLTLKTRRYTFRVHLFLVSVPIRGLFNLTGYGLQNHYVI